MAALRYEIQPKKFGGIKMHGILLFQCVSISHNTFVGMRCGKNLDIVVVAGL